MFFCRKNVPDITYWETTHAANVIQHFSAIEIQYAVEPLDAVIHFDQWLDKDYLNPDHKVHCSFF